MLGRGSREPSRALRRAARLGVLGLVACWTIAFQASAATAAPFPCTTSTIFIAQKNPTQLEALAYGGGGGTFTDIGAPVSPPYNAMGFSQSDHFIYAVNNQGRVVRVHSNGTTTDLGTAAGLAGGFVNAGAVDAAGGTLYAMRSAEQVLYKITLAPLAATPIALSALPASSDLTFVEGLLWGQTTDGTTSSLVRVNPVTGQVDKFPVAFVPGSVAAGGAWTYGNGNLGISDNTTGTIYQIDIDGGNTATPTFTLVGTSPGPKSSLNDGTSCVSPPVDLAISKTGPATILKGSTITWTVGVHNNGAGDSSGYTVTDVVPPGVTGISSPTPGCSVNLQTVTCTGAALAVGGDRAITIKGTVTADAGTTLTNTATVLGNEADPASANNQASASTLVRDVTGICRGTALRTGDILGLVGGLLFGTANEPESPCVTTSKTEVGIHPGILGLGADTLNGATQKVAGGTRASASVEQTTLSPLLATISIGAVQSFAAAQVNGDCTTALGGSSNVSSITINGTTTLVGNAPRTINVPLVGTIYLNRQIKSGTTITQQAVAIDLIDPLPDVVIAESKAGASCT